MKKRSLYISLDVDFLLALAAGDEDAAECIDIIHKIRGYPVVTPSVLQELQEQVLIFEGTDNAQLPFAAFRLITDCHILCPPLEAIEHGIAEAAAQKLLRAELCESKQTALVIAEASIINCRILLTNWEESLRMSQAKMNLILLGQDLSECLILPPQLFREILGD